MQQSLLASRRFAPLFWRQFFAAFNDNFVKTALVLLILFQIGGHMGASLVTLSSVVFITPFFLLSALGGEIADKYDKALISRRLSLAEIGVSCLSAAGFLLSSVPTLFAALFLTGVASALFGPIKYGILPDHLAREELPSANALVGGATFLAILTGAIAGGFAMQPHGDIAFAVGVVTVAVASYAAAWFIPATQRAEPDLKIDANVVRSTFSLLRLLRTEPARWRLTAVTSLFWLFGSIALSLMPPLVAHVLHGAESVVTLHLAVFAVAVAAGSGLAAFVLHGRILLMPTVVGAALVAVASGDLGASLLLRSATDGAADLGPSAYFAQPGALRITFDLGLLALAGGLMIVPAMAAIQAGSPPEARARTVAAVNVHNAAFMALGGVAVAAMQNFGVSLAALLLGMAAVALGAAVWIWKAVVARPFVDALSIFVRAFYRLEVKGREGFDRVEPVPAPCSRGHDRGRYFAAAARRQGVYFSV